VKAVGVRWLAALIPFISALCVAVPLAAQGAAATEPAGPVMELLRNGSFEETDTTGAPVAWRTEGLLIPGVKVDVVKATSGRPGGKALRLLSESTPAQVASFNGPFDVSAVAGRDLEVSCFYKTSGVPSAYMDLDTYAEPFAEKGWETPYLTLEQHALDETPTWRLLTWRVRCPANAREAVLIIAATAAGEVAVDDISVRLAEPPVRLEPSVLGDLVGWPARREVRLTIVNDTAEARDLKVTLVAVAKRPSPKRVASVQVPAHGREEVVLNYDMRPDDAHSLQISLDDAETPAVCDALVADLPGVLSGRIVQPNFRGVLLASIPTEEVVVEGRIEASDAICSQLSLEAELGGAGCIARDGQGISRPAGANSWRLAFPREGMLTGRYWLKVTAVRDGKPVATLPLELSRVPSKSCEVGLDSVGRLLVSGKPIFVNGLYNVTQPDDVDRAAAQGFTAVVVPTQAAGQALSDRVQQSGLKMIVYSPIPPERPGGSAPSFWEHMADKYGDLPSVIGWHLQGGPDASLVRIDTFKGQQADMARIDAYHPTVTRLSVPSLLPIYAPWCDIVAVESQPIPAMAVDALVSDVEAARAAARPGQPVWAVIQSVGRAWLVRGGGLQQGGSGRPPTGAEHQAMALLAVAHGAQGLLHRGFFFSATSDRDEYLLNRDAPDLWEGMKATNGLIASLADALAAGSYRGVKVSGPLHVGAWEYDGRLFVLAVNSQPSAALTTFSVPDPEPAGLRHLDDGSEVLRTGKGQFADDIPGYGARVYVTPLAPAG
jgi:hypothetical protein